MRIVVTGGAGQLARVLLPQLCALREVERVIALDRREPVMTHPKLTTQRVDLLESDLHASFAGADCLIHLAWILERGRLTHGQLHTRTVELGKKIFRAADDAGIKTLIHLSSAAVYGNGIELTEAAPLAPLPGFAYAEHKAEFEAWLAQNLPRATVLRPHVILGPHAHPVLKRLLALPVYPRLPEPQPKLQCVHEDDVADAIVLALNGPGGAFNLAADDCFDYRCAIQACHKHAIGIPYGIAKIGLVAAWTLFGFGAEPGWIAGMRADLTLDCSRAREVLGWQPRFGSRETLRLAG